MGLAVSSSAKTMICHIHIARISGVYSILCRNGAACAAVVRKDRR